MRKAQREKRPWMNLRGGERKQLCMWERDWKKERNRERERERTRKRGGWRQIESSNITDPQISFWVLVQLELSSECLLKAPFLWPFHCCRAFRVRWWQIVSYLISFIILPSGGVCSALSKSWRTNKQPAWFDGLQGDICSAVQNENNMLQ